MMQLTFGQSAELAKQDAIQQCEDNADPEVKDRIMVILFKMSHDEHQPPFNVNDLRAEYVRKWYVEPKELRIFGSMLISAQAKGWIEPCGGQKSGRERNHNNRITIWRSRVYAEPPH